MLLWRTGIRTRCRPPHRQSQSVGSSSHRLPPSPSLRILSFSLSLSSSRVCFSLVGVSGTTRGVPDAQVGVWPRPRTASCSTALRCVSTLASPRSSSDSDRLGLLPQAYWCLTAPVALERGLDGRWRISKGCVPTALDYSFTLDKVSRGCGVEFSGCAMLLMNLCLVRLLLPHEVLV